MCDDVPAFADASVTLVLGIIKKFFMMVAFSGENLICPSPFRSCWHTDDILLGVDAVVCRSPVVSGT